MGGWCRVSTNLWLFRWFFLSSGLRGITCQNPGWSFPRLLPWMLLLLRLLWDRRRGSQETGRSPVGGRVTLRILDAGDLVLGLAMIPGDLVDFHCSLLGMGMGCACEGAHGHPQIPVPVPQWFSFPLPPLPPYSLSWQNICVLRRGNPVAFGGQYQADRNVLARRAFR